MGEIVAKPSAASIEQVLTSGDLSKLSAQERVSYVHAVCESLGLNPLTRPFEYQSFQNKLILYARKDATEQLRKIHGVSVTEIKKEVIGDLLHVTVYGGDRTGKKDLATGVINIAGLTGEALANAHMKGETKAKRRFTLSICGLGLLDETEVEDLRDASPNKANQVNALLNEAPAEIELESEPQPEEPDFLTDAAQESAVDPGDYVIPIGKKYVGKRLSELSPDTLKGFVEWVKTNITNKNSATIEFITNAEAYLGGR